MDNEGSSNALLNILNRFESQLAGQNHNSLVELFCLQIIPFIEQHTLIGPLRESWCGKYISLQKELDFYEKKTQEELTKIFAELLEHLENRQEKLIQIQISHIQTLVDLLRNLKF